MTARCSEIAQVRCDCLAQVDVAAIRRITQQVNAFFCQNLSSETFPCSYWKFIDGGNARHLVPRPSPRGRTDFQRVHPELLLRVQRCELDAELAGRFSVGPRLKSSPEEDSRRTCRTRVSNGGNLQHEVLKARA